MEVVGWLSSSVAAFVVGIGLTIVVFKLFRL
jgi:hypothetical protein